MYCSENFLFQSCIKLRYSTELKRCSSFLCYFFLEESLLHDRFEAVDDSINGFCFFGYNNWFTFSYPGKWSSIAYGLGIIIISVDFCTIYEEVELHCMSSLEAVNIFVHSENNRHISTGIGTIVSCLVLDKRPF